MSHRTRKPDVRVGENRHSQISTVTCVASTGVENSSAKIAAGS